MAFAEEENGIVDRASRGDPTAVELLLQEHLPRLHAFVRLRMGTLLRTREESGDLVQSVCRVILSHQGDFRHAGEEQFRRWLFTTAQRVVADKVKYWKRARRDAGRELPATLGDGEVLSISAVFGSLLTPSRIVSARERLARFERAFDALPDDYREVISLARVLDLPHREVAQRLGRSELATRALLHRALATLAGKLGDP
jgi:RNA polymerase sigma-70 factor (ECF subfamily)